MLLQLPARRADRLAVGVHVRLGRRTPALAQIARGAGRGDILPRRAPTISARDHMVEGQLAARPAIDAAEFVAEEEIEPGEGRIFVGPDVIAQRNDAREL